MKPLRTAVIGFGHLGRIHAKLLAQVDGAQLVAVVDPSDSARQNAEATHSVPTFAAVHEVLDRIDAAIVASPSDLHAEAAGQLLSADKHVLVEKPITVRAADAEQLVRLAESRRRVLQVGHVERFNPTWAAAAPITAGAKYVECTRASRFPGRCLDVGVVMDLMIHDIDLVLSLSSGTLCDVRAGGMAVVSDHEDIAEARLEFDCGLVANFKASRISPLPSRRMTTFGPEGFADIDFSALTLTTVKPTDSLVERTFDLATEAAEPMKFADELFSDYLPVQVTQVDARNAILDELHDFVISVQSQSEPTVSGAAGARAVEAAERILEQIAVRRWTDSGHVAAIGPHAVPRESIETASRRHQQRRKAA